MLFNAQDKTKLERLKLFVAIFLGGKLGGGLLEGLNLAKVLDNIICFK